MSFSQLSYDPCAYNKSLTESLGPGQYLVDAESRTKVNKEAFYTSPYVRLERSGVAECVDRPLIDVDSELMGIKKAASRCPGQPDAACALTKMSDVTSALDPEDTKLSNPPCTLRGSGWNRWEWLERDPQDKAILPFPTNVQNKLVVRDNHRPCVPTPQDQNAVLPSGYDDECYTDRELEHVYKSMANDAAPPLMHWRQCCEIQKL